MAAIAVVVVLLGARLRGLQERLVARLLALARNLLTAPPICLARGSSLLAGAGRGGLPGLLS